MSLEIMQRIEQTEAEAEKIRQEALRQARDVVKAVEGAVAQSERAAAIENRALYTQEMEEKRQQVEKLLLKKAEAQAAERKKRCDDAQTRLNQAATLIYRRVVQHGDR